MSSDDTPKDYGVGYKRPPLHSRFKPGRSGNPSGRPRKSNQIEDLIRHELDATIVVTEGGREQRITKREAVIKQLVNLAIKGNTKPLQLVLAHLEKHRAVDPFVSTAADDAELLKAMTLAQTGKDDSQ
jgi:Family of unknown function (DUF5681)